jgi:hypothetical protein
LGELTCCRPRVEPDIQDSFAGRRVESTNS